MRKIYILVLLLTAFGASSCNDWLDVRPETEQKEDDQFSTYNGFCSAVTGLYMLMGNQDIYGERLSMTNIESLANLWDMTDNTYRYEDYYLMKHDYENVTYSQAAIKAIYAQLFNTIVQANVIIKHVDEQGDVISDPAVRATIQGEAYGIRAYCHLDVLRLFGQVPGGTEQVSLPYSETTSIDEMPAYYTFDEFVGKLKQDIEKAESLLKDNDPVFQYSFTALNSGSTSSVDDFMFYRQSRMNYWAVKALEARMYRYLGDDANAYRAAREVIDATLDGNPVMTMSGTQDFASGYKLCPNECLFYLSKYDVMDYSQDFLVGGSSTSFDERNNLGLTSAMHTELFSTVNPNSNNRAGNCLYNTYMLAHNVPNMPSFTSADDLKDFIVDEYRREFYAEGQMFYTYKRLNSTSMLWRDEPVGESEYILPLPTTEYNPNR